MRQADAHELGDGGTVGGVGRPVLEIRQDETLSLLDGPRGDEGPRGSDPEAPGCGVSEGSHQEG